MDMMRVDCASRGKAVTREQAVRMIVFLKEAAGQIDNARVVAVNAADARTLGTLKVILRAVVAEIDYLELSKNALPPSRA